MNRPRLGCAVVFGWWLALAVASGQPVFPGQQNVSSISGQFVVSSALNDAPFFRVQPPPGSTNFIRLEPALLTVAVERFKLSLWRQIGLAADVPWSGKIFLVVHPARSLDDVVNITSSPFLSRWDYRVELPDLISNTRYARALTAVLLQEIADRTAPADGHAAEIPAWLLDGLAQQVLAADGEKILLSAPANPSGGRPVSRFDQVQFELDPLAAARRILQNEPVLTFDELSWPTAAQLAGADGGAYDASAQLFLHELLALNNGPAKLRNLLAELPGHYNWQTAFYLAFHADFQRPLDVEKWWSLRVVSFAARSPGPRWTTAVSRDRLAGMLSVPVEFRGDSNALPTHAEISLQAALQNLSPDVRDWQVRIKLRDLALVELRLAPPFGQLAEGYRAALADFLGENKKAAANAGANHHSSVMKRQASISDTLKKLDALDRRRREIEAHAIIPLPGNPETGAP